MLKSIEGNFDHPEVNDLLTKHFIELRAASPKESTHVLDIPGLSTSTRTIITRSASVDWRGTSSVHATIDCAYNLHGHPICQPHLHSIAVHKI